VELYSPSAFCITAIIKTQQKNAESKSQATYSKRMLSNYFVVDLSLSVGFQNDHTKTTTLNKNVPKRNHSYKYVQRTEALKKVSNA